MTLICDRLDVTPLTRAVGATVAGVDLRAPLDEHVLHTLRAAVIRHGVVFVRDQQLDAAEQEALAARFGRLAVSPLHRLLGTGRTSSVIQDDADHPPAKFDWHTDLSWTERPPAFGFLHTLEIPSVGGDTIWASLTAAYAALSPSLQMDCNELRAAHAPDHSLIASVERNHGSDIALQLRHAHPAVAHPLVRRHPETGEPLLFLSPLYVRRLIGVHRQRAERLLFELNRLLDNPLVQVRWRWRAGDVAIWDEAATCHRALGDHFPDRRRMRRCVVEGDVPVAFSGN